MDDEAAAQIKKRMSELPEDVQEAIRASDLTDRLRAIGTKRQLHIDQIGKLEDETLLVMLGFSNPEVFAKRLGKTLGIVPEAAQTVAQDVSNEVFMPIRESLKTLNAAPASTTPPLPVAPVSKPTAPTTPLAEKLLPAEHMLSEKTLSTPPQKPPVPPASTVLPDVSRVTPPKPAPYKADPYREPAE